MLAIISQHFCGDVDELALFLRNHLPSSFVTMREHELVHPMGSVDFSHRVSLNELCRDHLSHNSRRQEKSGRGVKRWDYLESSRVLLVVSSLNLTGQHGVASLLPSKVIA